MTKILLADDSRNIREYCRQVLEDDGYCVVEARDGLEAVRVFRAETPDLAILDLRMPWLNGLDVLECIKAIRPEFPVVIFTANDEDCIGDGRSALATACIEKSEDLTELKRAVVRGLHSASGGCDGSALRLGLGRATLYPRESLQW
ncbi:MAG: response regulator [Planctomycetota bacterium]|nr:response regulator [Planctomycetota bacterium]